MALRDLEILIEINISLPIMVVDIIGIGIEMTSRIFQMLRTIECKVRIIIFTKKI